MNRTTNLPWNFTPTKEQMAKLLSRPLPFTVSYHGDSTIILDGNGEWATQQVNRHYADEIAKWMTEYVKINKLP